MSAAIAGGGALLLFLMGSAPNTSGDSEPRQVPKRTKPQPGSEKAIKAFMRQKLSAMRQVLHGIVTEDYALIRRNAESMKKMGTAAEWNVVQGPIYGNHSESFLRSADLLAIAAKDKNTDGAALVYMQITLNCVECHRYTREPNVRRKTRVQYKSIQTK